jgi:hypothetical protein
MLGLKETEPNVMCPGCDEPMRAVERKSILFTDGLVDVTFTCEMCRTWAIHTLMPDDEP